MTVTRVISAISDDDDILVTTAARASGGMALTLGGNVTVTVSVDQALELARAIDSYVAAAFAESVK